LTFSSLDDIIKSTHAIDAKGGRLPIGIPGRLQIGMHGRLRRYPQRMGHLAITTLRDLKNATEHRRLRAEEDEDED